MSSIRIRTPKKPRKLVAHVMHSNHEKVPTITGFHRRVSVPAPNVTFVAFDGVDGKIAVAYHAPNNWLYFLAEDQNGQAVLTNLEDTSNIETVLAFNPTELDRVAAKITSEFDLPLGGAV